MLDVEKSPQQVESQDVGDSVASAEPQEVSSDRNLLLYSWGQDLVKQQLTDTCGRVLVVDTEYDRLA